MTALTITKKTSVKHKITTSLAEFVFSISSNNDIFITGNLQHTELVING